LYWLHWFWFVFIITITCFRLIPCWMYLILYGFQQLGFQVNWVSVIPAQTYPSPAIRDHKRQLLCSQSFSWSGLVHVGECVHRTGL